jgi:GH15 family glucan-1,4-alpha-glucosidase
MQTSNVKHAYTRIADYGLIGDCHTAALVSRFGSVDWLCVPRFDSPSLFGRILDADRGGCFAIQPADSFDSSFEYIDNSGVLRTTFETDRGKATLTDFMPLASGASPQPFSNPRAPHRLIRIIEGVAGEVAFNISLQPRPNYGRDQAAFGAFEHGLAVNTGDGNLCRLYCSVELAVRGMNAETVARVREGERLVFVLELQSPPEPAAGGEFFGALNQLDSTLAFWKAWIKGCRYEGPYADAVARSAITLKLLTYAPTGGMVAAPTTSLPEEIGGVRNWDYRYTWIRDASFGFYALSLAGHPEDAAHFLEWVCDIGLQPGAGELNVMYGLNGEKHLPEYSLDHWEGYMRSRPVRVGNQASTQFQLDIYGELLDCFHTSRRLGHLSPELLTHLWAASIKPQVDFVAGHWHKPGHGIWEVRSEPKQFVYSKVMAWVALDRGVKAAEELGLDADLDEWRNQRTILRTDILQKGYNPAINSFSQTYGDGALDAANLLLPLVRFIDALDPRMRATIEAVRQRLFTDGMVYRYRGVNDGLPGGEATFGVCTFWLVDNLTAIGNVEDARALFERMLERASGLGLFAEELDPGTGAHLGNFPQALTHIGLINAAINLTRAVAHHVEKKDLEQMRDVTGSSLKPAHKTAATTGR